MNKADLNKLNLLFEKMVDNAASVSEQQQLELLYQVFINEDRKDNNVIPFTTEKKAG